LLINLIYKTWDVVVVVMIKMVSLADVEIKDIVLPVHAIK